MDNLQWFKFSPSHWFMGRIQRCSEITQARFMRVVCVYWTNECQMSAEDAEIELGEDEYKELLRQRIIELDGDYIRIKFLDEQFEGCLALGNKRSLAAKVRWDKAKAMQLHTPAMQDNADKIREEEIRLEKKRKDKESFDKFWNLYDKKQGTEAVRKKWGSISQTDKALIFEHIPKYVAATPDKQFRKLPLSYLNQQTWLDEELPALKQPIRDNQDFKNFDQVKYP